jgi:hypothetical protein
MEFRNASEADGDVAEASLFDGAPAAASAPRAQAKEAGASPAVAMTQKTEAREADLVTRHGADALADAMTGAMTGALAAAAAPRVDDSK